MVPRKLFSTLTLTTGLLLGGVAAYAQAVSNSGPGNILDKSTPGFLGSSRNLGPEDPALATSVSVWLNFHNREAMDTLAEQLYDRNSVNYHRWLARKDIVSRFAPTLTEAQQVQRYLSAKGLKNVTIGPDNFFVRAEGNIGEVQKAFQVHINKYQFKNQILHANTANPFVEASVAPLVSSISGLTSATFSHHNVNQSTFLSKTGRAPQFAKAAATPSEPFFSDTCFTGVRTESFTSFGSYPAATYKGNGYYSDPTGPGCGYTPADIRAAYNLNALYKEGFDGTGQTIVIIDWCGSPTIRQDANEFSARFGLPPLTDTSFKIINYPTPSTCAGEDPEINIDVEWAHAIAPGANITLLVPPSANFADIDAAQVYAEEEGLGTVISGSYGAEEYFVDPREVLNQNLVNEIGALLGISANFSSGDYGDYTFDFPQFNPASVIVPAATPFATAIGGVSLALNKDKSIAWQSGWGTNITELRYANGVDAPPASLGFQFGSGGGFSPMFAKPYYQKSLSGSFRKLPDISWLADPYTGGVIAITLPGVYPIAYEAYGGTSLACPMFAGLWAIANQEAGGLLGQAAPYLYSMPSSTITDIVGVSSPNNVTGTIFVNSKTSYFYSAAALASPLEGTKTFYSTLWDSPSIQDTTYVLTFGTDSGLRTAAGWDNVTGLGTPNGKAFADYFNPASTK